MNQKTGDGWIGVGFSLQRLSSIGREATDHGLPQWDDRTDRYTLDELDLAPV